MTQVAAKKTSALLGDDLALNAEQVSGVSAKRELPVVWAVAKGSFLNKLILVPLALLMSYFAPWLITPLLMVGGAYLCFEGFEKITHKLFHKDDDKEHKAARKQALIDPSIDLVALEKKKIKGAIRTDFILSAEIIVIALSTVSEEAFFKQAMVVSLIAFVMTIGVYGLVAAIVRFSGWWYFHAWYSCLTSPCRKVCRSRWANGTIRPNFTECCCRLSCWRYFSGRL